MEGARERELSAQFIRSQTGFGVEQGRAYYLLLPVA